MENRGPLAIYETQFGVVLRAGYGFRTRLPALSSRLLAWALIRARREPLWAEAYRRLGRNKLAVTAIAIIGLYGLVAFLDSIGTTDKVSQDRTTVIDWMFKRDKEKTYSAPLRLR